jgi:hypothetical protein
MNTMMSNEQFMKNTLILVTFDENGKIQFSFRLDECYANGIGRCLLSRVLRYPQRCLQCSNRQGCPELHQLR